MARVPLGLFGILPKPEPALPSPPPLLILLSADRRAKDRGGPPAFRLCELVCAYSAIRRTPSPRPAIIHEIIALAKIVDVALRSFYHARSFGIILNAPRIPIYVVLTIGSVFRVMTSFEAIDFKDRNIFFSFFKIIPNYSKKVLIRETKD